MFDWIKFWSKSKQEDPKDGVVNFVFKDGKPVTADALKSPRCLLHQDYDGYSVPINNCNGCWEFHSIIMRRKGW